MIFDELPLPLHLEQGNSLENSVENILARSHSLLNSTRRLNSAEPNTAAPPAKEPPLRLRSSLPVVGPAENVSVSTAFGALYAHLEECRDVLRQVDSERRFFRQKGVRLRESLGDVNREKDHLRDMVAELQRDVRKARRNAMEFKNKMRDLEASIVSATEENMRLRRFLRSLPIAQDDALVLVPDRRFEEAFRDKMSAIKYKRLYGRTKQLYETRSESIEAERMRIEDGYILKGEPLGASTLNLRDKQSLESTFLSNKLSMLGLSNSLSASRRASSYVGSDVLTFPFQLHFSHVTANDSYVTDQIQQSAYKELLHKFREDLFHLCHRLKQAQDRGLCGMYCGMPEVFLTDTVALTARQENLKQTFEMILEKTQHAHRDLLYELVELVNSFVVRMVEHEVLLTDNSSCFRRGVECDVCTTSPLYFQESSLGTRLVGQQQQQQPMPPQQPKKFTTMKPESVFGAPSLKKGGKELHRKAKLTLQQLLCLHEAFRSLLEVMDAPYLPSEAESNNVFSTLSLPRIDAVLNDPLYERKILEAVEADVRTAKRLAGCVQDVTKSSSASLGGNTRGSSARTPRLAPKPTPRREFSRCALSPRHGPMTQRPGTGEDEIRPWVVQLRAPPKRGRPAA